MEIINKQTINKTKEDLEFEIDFCNDCGRMEPDNPCICKAENKEKVET